MRIKCVNDKNLINQLTLDKVYHVMGEDAESYYIVDDNGNITAYDKNQFFLVSRKAQPKRNCSIILPNHDYYLLDVHETYTISGQYTMQVDENYKTMYVLNLRDGTSPIAISEDDVYIVER